MRVLFHLLPSRIKRLLFIASLSAWVLDKEELDRSTRMNMVAQFSLCSDPDALALPIAMKDKIWKNRPISPLMKSCMCGGLQTEKDVTRKARQIVAMMPCWLVYDKTLSIVQDTKALLSVRNELMA